MNLRFVNASTLLAFLLTGCSRELPRNFVMPSWETSLSVPLFTRTATLGEIIGQDSVITMKGDTTSVTPVSSSGMISTSESIKLSTMKVGSNLKMCGLAPEKITHLLGTFEIASSEPMAFLIRTSSAMGTRSLIGHKVVPRPVPLKKYSSSSARGACQFTTAQVISAKVNFRIVNYYGEEIDAPDGIVFQDSAGNSLFRIDLPGGKIGPYQSYSKVEEITNVRLSRNLTAVVSLSAAGGTDSILIKSDTLVLMTMSLTSIKSNSASAIVACQSPVPVKGWLPLGDSYHIESAMISAGSVNMHMNNNLEMPCRINIVVPALKSREGVSFSVDQVLASVGDPGRPDPQSEYSSSVSLAGWVLNLGTVPTDSIGYTLTVTPLGSGSEFIPVSSADSIDGTFSVSELTLSSITGIVRLPNPIPIIPDTESINLSFLRNSFGPQDRLSDSARMTLNLRLLGNLPALLRLRISASSNKPGVGEVDTTVVSQIVYPGAQGNIIVLGECFADMLNDFISATGTFPDRFIIDGTATVNPTGMLGTISEADAITGNALISCPLEVGLENFDFQESSGNLSFSSDVRKALQEVDSGEVVFQISNSMPVGLRLSLSAVDTLTRKVLFVLPDTGQVFVPAACELDSTGNVTQPMMSRITVGIPGPDARMLEHSFLRFMIDASTSDGHQTVPFFSSSSFSLNVMANLKMNVGGN